MIYYTRTFLLKPLDNFEFQVSPCSYHSNSEIDYDITPSGLTDSKQLYYNDFLIAILYSGSMVDIQWQLSAEFHPWSAVAYLFQRQTMTKQSNFENHFTCCTNVQNHHRYIFILIPEEYLFYSV